MAPSHELILYHYVFSPYAKRIVWYLNLRGIPYTQCLQPPIMPRPDVAAIGTSYRRIPILSCGLDIYNDTRLIISKLNTLFPPSATHPPLAAPPSSEQAGVEKLLEFWSVEGLFSNAAALIPSDLPLLKDERFKKDREDFSGVSWQPENMEKGRREALVEVRKALELLESTLLADGREWILKTEGPSLGDIEAIWPFHWLTTLPGALPPTSISATQFPKVFAWIKRFDEHTRAAAKKAGKPKTIKGDEVVKMMHQAGLVEASLGVDETDPSGLRLGDKVEVWPIDSGSRYKDRGRLVGLNEKEIVVETQGGQVAGVMVHAPRHGFRVRKMKAGNL